MDLLREKGRQIFLEFLSELEAIEIISWLGLRDGSEYEKLLENDVKLDQHITKTFDHYWELMTPSDKEEYINEVGI